MCSNKILWCWYSYHHHDKCVPSVGTQRTVHVDYIRWHLKQNKWFSISGLVWKLIADHHSQYKAAGKRTQHCWPTTPNIVRCYMLGPFANPVECCWVLLRVFPQSQIGQTFSPVPRNIVGSCFVRLHVALSLTGFNICPTTPNNTQQQAKGCANGRNM